MIALASVIASPLFGPLRGARGARPRLFLTKEVTKKSRSPTLPRASADCTVRSQPSRHSIVDSLVSAPNHDNGIVSVYLAVDFVNLQFVTYMAAQERQRCTAPGGRGAPLGGHLPLHQKPSASLCGQRPARDTPPDAAIIPARGAPADHAGIVWRQGLGVAIFAILATLVLGNSRNSENSNPLVAMLRISPLGTMVRLLLSLRRGTPRYGRGHVATLAILATLVLGHSKNSRGLLLNRCVVISVEFEVLPPASARASLPLPAAAHRGRSMRPGRSYLPQRGEAWGRLAAVVGERRSSAVTCGHLTPPYVPPALTRIQCSHNSVVISKVIYNAHR
jgi:hypothetical protein